MENESDRNRRDELPPNSFAIFQVKAGEEYHLLRFSSLDEIKPASVDRGNYDLVYTGKLDVQPGDTTGMILERLFERFNIAHTADYTGHSMSVSDVVVLNRNGSISSHYVEPIGFVEIKGFSDEQNYLRNTEMALEDDYGMIDGILNNGKKESIREALRESCTETNPVKENRTKPAKARADMERE